MRLCTAPSVVDDARTNPIQKKPPPEQDGGFLFVDQESVEGDDSAVFLRNSGEFSQNSLELITIHGFLFD